MRGLSAESDAFFPGGDRGSFERQALAFLLSFVARGLRILQDFAGLCRVVRCILLTLGETIRNLDQHIGVRIPGGHSIT